MNEEPRRLPELLRYHGFEYRMVIRNKYAIIYEQWTTKYTTAQTAFRDPNEPLHHVGYEIHQIRIKEPHRSVRHGKNGELIEINLPLREVWASDEEFGDYGWQYQTLNAAERKYIQVTKKCQRKKNNERKKFPNEIQALD